MSEQPALTQRPKEQWGSRIGVVLAVAGSAVGLGNFLRFPGLAAQNGGGAFMVPYFCALIFLGIPICWAEWTMGKYGGQFGFNSAPAIFGVLGRRPAWRYVGVLGVLIPVVIYMYYVYIESWCLQYAWNYLVGGINLGTDKAQFAEESAKFFTSVTGDKSDGVMLHGSIHQSVVFWVIVFTINFFLIFRGVSRGIEVFCKYAVPLMALCAVAVLIRVLTLDNIGEGLGFMWNPKPKAAGESWLTQLLNPDVWLAATGQIFFSLSVGFGVIINYASYLKRKDDVVLSGLTASSTNEFFEVCLGGLITVPAAFLFLGSAGLSKDVLNSSFALGFKTLPVVFEYMRFGHFFGFCWFFMLFLAAITSSLSMLQPAIAFLEEGLRIGRRASVTILGLVTASGSFLCIWFSKDLAALDTMDFWVGTAMIFVLAMVQVFLFAWVFGVDRGVKFAEDGAEIRLPRAFKFVISFVAPLYLLVVFLLWCISNLPGYIKQLLQGGVPLFIVLFIAGIVVFLLILIYLAGKHWNAENADTSRA
ncbi:MAG: sodium-dependent transporter [Phycisphaerales bacterium]|nr:sodium-dependent transporter [Phycisphaerales bacterium]